jgi:DNA-binding transcriptional LysR family regulator
MEPAEGAHASLTIGFVPGVAPGKWFGRWRERQPDIPLDSFQTEIQDQVRILRDGRADMSFVRLPIDREGLSVIPLYRERPVVVAPRDHEIALFEEVDAAELEGENILDPAGMGGAATGIEVVASGAGLMILPMSVARLYSRRDVVYRPVRGLEETQIALAWPEGKTTEIIEEFIGIVRGRTERSSRQPSSRQPSAQQAEGSRTQGESPRKQAAGRKRTGGAAQSGGRTRNPRSGGRSGRRGRR